MSGASRFAAYSVASGRRARTKPSSRWCDQLRTSHSRWSCSPVGPGQPARAQIRRRKRTPRPMVGTGKEMTMQQAWLEDLSIEECVALLRGEAVGRIAFVLEGLPVVLPVNYHLLETPTGIVLTLRTRPDGSIDRAPRAVALEIDGIDHSHQRGWSVLVRGSLRHVAARDGELRERFRVVPWLPAESRTCGSSLTPLRSPVAGSRCATIRIGLSCQRVPVMDGASHPSGTPTRADRRVGVDCRWGLEATDVR